MTPDDLEEAISKIITVQFKPRSTQNSHHRKEWENRKNWRLCTVGKSCKVGMYKQIFNDGKRHEDTNLFLFSYYGGITGIYRRFCEDTRVRKYSYNSKYMRQRANRYIRHCYKGKIGDHGCYKKIFDYEWECW